MMHLITYLEQQHESRSPAGIPNIQELVSGMFQLRLILTSAARADHFPLPTI